jgi:hypothetical protein
MALPKLARTGDFALVIFLLTEKDALTQNCARMDPIAPIIKDGITKIGEKSIIAPSLMSNEIV